MGSHPIAVLKMPKKVKNVITYGQSVVTAMTGNPSFPSPTPPLTTFESDVSALNTAETAVLSRVKGAVEIRDAKLATVENGFKSLLAYVQGVANAGTPTDAPALIEGAGFTVRHVGSRDKPALSAKGGSVTGSVKLTAKAGGSRAAYNWQYSTDQKTWTSLPQTMQAKTGAQGLTAGLVYYFRVQILLPAGEQNWSQVVSLLVQ
jgi:hypothetical protein